MEKLFKLLFILICIILTVSCKTVKDEEENNFGLASANDEILDEIILSDSLIEAVFKQMPTVVNRFYKEGITVFPNPTSSFVTIEIKPIIKVAPDGQELITYFDWFNFRYELMFDEKIIFQSSIKSLPRDIWQEVIPEHLLQNSGRYTIIYEFIEKDNGNVYDKGTLNFMVVKQQ